MAQMAVIVRAGDTPETLSTRYGTSPRDFYQLNPTLKELRGGMVVYVPDPKKPEKTPVASQTYGQKMLEANKNQPTISQFIRGIIPTKTSDTSQYFVAPSSKNVPLRSLFKEQWVAAKPTTPRPDTNAPANAYRERLYKLMEDFATGKIGTLSPDDVTLVARMSKGAFTKSMVEKSLIADGFVQDDNGFWTNPERENAGGDYGYGDKLRDSYPMTYEGNRALEQHLKDEGYEGNRLIVGNEIIRRNGMGNITSRIEIKGSGASQGLRSYGAVGHTAGR